MKKLTFIALFLFSSFLASSTVYRVNVNTPCTGTCTETGADWNHAFDRIQDALAIAIDGDEIWVAAGTYYPSYSNDRSEPLLINGSISLYGGFEGSHETSLSERNWEANPTTISGDIGVEGDVTDNSKRLMVMSPSWPFDKNAVIDGFILEKGYSDFPEGTSVAQIYGVNSKLTVNNCIIRHNDGSISGCFLIGNGNVLHVNNALFHDNKGMFGVISSGNGGQFKGTNITYIDNAMSDNLPVFTPQQAYNAGGMFGMINVQIENSIFWDNAVIRFSSQTVTAQNMEHSISQFLTSNSGTNSATDPNLDNAFKPQLGSVAIDNGNNSYNSFPLDLAHQARQQNSTIDIGAYEYNCSNSSFSYTKDCATNAHQFWGSIASGSHFWDFGDGNTSTLANPTNAFQNQGSYVVSYSHTNCGVTSSRQQTVYNVEPSSAKCGTTLSKINESFNVQLKAGADSKIVEVYENGVFIGSHESGHPSFNLTWVSGDIHYDATYELVIKNNFNGTIIRNCAPCYISTPSYDCDVELTQYMANPNLPYQHTFRIRTQWGVVDAGYDAYEQSSGAFAGRQERHANADLTLWGVSNGVGIDYNTTYRIEPYVVLNDGRTIVNCNAQPILLHTPAYDCHFGITNYQSGDVVPYQHTFRIQSQNNTAESGFDVYLKSNYTLIGSAERHANADISLRNVIPTIGSPGIEASTAYYIRPYNTTIFGDKIWTCSGDIELITDASPNYRMKTDAIMDENMGVFATYPNPSNGMFSIEYEAGMYESLQVISSNGSSVLEVNLPEGSSRFQLDLSDQPTGIYLLKLCGQETVATTRLSKR